MDQVTLNVDGMSCAHCVNAVKKAVGALEGVKDVYVSLENKTVTVKHDAGVSVDRIKAEIEDQGYDVQ